MLGRVLSANGTITTQNLNATGAATAGSAIQIDGLDSTATINIHVTVNTLNQALTPSITLDGVNYVALSPTGLVNLNTGAYSATIPAGTTGMWQASLAAGYSFRLSEQSACTGSATAFLSSTMATSGVCIDTPIPLLAKSSQPTANTDGKFTSEFGTLIGAKVMRPHCIPEMEISNAITVTTNAQTALFAAAGAGIKNYVMNLSMQNTNATATTIAIQDGSTTRMNFNLPASMTAPIVLSGTTPLFTVTANTAVNVTCGTTGANVYINASGYKAP